MGLQLPLFDTPRDRDDELNRALAERRRSEMDRQQARGPNPFRRHRRSKMACCPSCGACVTIPLE